MNSNQHQVLSRKWRPQFLRDVLGQGHVTRAIKNALLAQTIGQVYLFTGTRGVGKTTIARILARAIRCQKLTAEAEACGQCPSCLDFDSNSSLDIVEIDGASHNSVDDVRELIANTHYLPSIGNKKVYIIDEVHMLSLSAFNALLKTLEEPPSHVVFIFATTEPHKLPGTVLSRCQRYDLKNMLLGDLILLVKKIGAAEGIQFADENCILQLATLGHGSGRDTLSIFEQILAFADGNIISEQTLLETLGLAKTSSLEKMLEYIFTGDASSVQTLYSQMINENVVAPSLLRGILDLLAKKINTHATIPGVSLAEVFWVYESLVKDGQWAIQSLAPVQVIGILLQKMALRRSFLQVSPAAVVPAPHSSPVHTEQEIVTSVIAAPVTPIETTTPVTMEKPVEAPTVAPLSTLPKATETVAKHQQPSSWKDFIEMLYQRSPATASNLEQGNFLTDLDLSLSSPTEKIVIGFPMQNKIFMDYVREPDVIKKLKNHLAVFLNRDESTIDLEIKIVQDNEASSFQALAELEAKKKKEQSEKRENEFLNNPVLKMAQEMFNANIDKVVFNSRSHHE